MLNMKPKAVLLLHALLDDYEIDIDGITYSIQQPGNILCQTGKYNDEPCWLGVDLSLTGFVALADKLTETDVVSIVAMRGLRSMVKERVLRIRCYNCPTNAVSAFSDPSGAFCSAACQTAYDERQTAVVDAQRDTL